jgi:hypothetical protein
MPCARAMPTNHLMPAASSLTRTVAILWIGVPKRLSGRTPHSPHAGHPIHHHVAGLSPRTQISLGAGTPTNGGDPTATSHRRRQHMT